MAHGQHRDPAQSQRESKGARSRPSDLATRPSGTNEALTCTHVQGGKHASMYVKGGVLGQGRQHVCRRNSVGGQGGQAGHLESSLTPSLTSQVPLPARLSLILLIRKMGVSLPAGRAGRECQALHTEEAGDWYGKENVNTGVYRPGEGGSMHTS